MGELWGEADEIAVTAEGQPWVINNRQIYRLRGRTWQSMPGKARSIDSGGGTVWCIGENDQVYQWSEDGFSWENFGGGSQ